VPEHLVVVGQQFAIALGAHVVVKRPKHARDEEYRAVLVLAGSFSDAPDFIDLKLSNPDRFVRHLKLPSS
jgi:hypothetical protein